MIAAENGDIVIRRTAARAQGRCAAEAAAAESVAESQQYRLGAVSIRSLIADGRRG